MLNKVKSGYNFLLAVRAFFRVCQDINRLDEIIAVSDKMVKSNPQIVIRLVNFIKEQGGPSAAALAEKPRIGKLRTEDLKKYPEGSLGNGLAKYLIENNLNPEDLPNLSSNTPLEFVRAHFFETHDVWHVVTGFKTSVDGEMGLQAFGVAQYPIPLNCLNLAAGIINIALFSPDNRVSRMNEIVRGWQMGRKAKPFFGIQWNKMWDLPITQVRKDLNVELVPGPVSEPSAL